MDFYQGEAIKHLKQVLDQYPAAGTYGTDCSTNINWPSIIFQKLIAEIRDDSRQSVSGVNGILIGGQSDIYSRASLLQTAICLNKWYLPNQWWLQDFLMVGTEPKLEEDRGVDSFLIVNKCVRYIMLGITWEKIQQKMTPKKALTLSYLWSVSTVSGIRFYL